MIFSAAISILIPLLIGLLLVCLLWPNQKFTLSLFLIQASLAAAPGIGFFSCCFFLLLCFHGPSRSGLLALQLTVLVSLGAALAYRLKTKRREEAVEVSRKASGRFRFRRILGAAFLVALISAIITFIFVSLERPHGDWDAWAVHNMRARFIFRAGDQWRDVFSDLLEWSSPDYPLMIPGSIAGFWTLIGNDTVVVPAMLALLFTFATVGLLTSSLWVLRSRSQGFLAGLILLCTPLFITHGASQYLDIPFGFLCLATLTLVSLHESLPKGNNLLLLAGASAALSAWTKNEGLLFLVAILVGRFAVIVAKRGLSVSIKQMLSFGAGLLPVFAVLIYFKNHFAKSNAFLSPQGQSTLAKLIDPSRYLQILDASKDQILTFGAWPVSIGVLLAFYLLLMGITVDEKLRQAIGTSMIAFSIVLAGYFIIYLITPRDLAWHLLVSLNRLFLQLYPSLLFVYFLVVRSPEDALMRKDTQLAAVALD
ncbi:MAG TPA: glycosyltransferase family 39 protein [Blastocatellia bacterium]|nr:glycosyltransferase family 39 protein [Blastocatellia bacterium]